MFLLDPKIVPLIYLKAALESVAKLHIADSLSDHVVYIL